MFRIKHSKEECNAKTYPITCRVCGEKVYYFSCDHGAKVFFQELGPPWTQHTHEDIMKPIKTKMEVELKKIEAQFKETQSELDKMLTDHQHDLEFLTMTIEILTETIEYLGGILEPAKDQKSDLENNLIEIDEFLEDGNDKEFIGNFHSKSKIQGKSLSGPQEFTVNGKRISVSVRQVEELKAIYQSDKKRNSNAGPTGAIRSVLVDRGIIPKTDMKYAFNAVARIVGHLTPAQKRAVRSANKQSNGAKGKGFTEDSYSKPEIQGKPRSGPQTITINFKRYFLTARQVEELKSVYQSDKKHNPDAGPTGAIRSVLVDRGIIPKADINHAFNAVARIVGHLTPSQKRASMSVDERTKDAKGKGFTEDSYSKPEIQGKPPENNLRENDKLRRLRYPPGGKLGVTINGKIQIRHTIVADTFVAAIEKVGVDQVFSLGIECRRVPLMSTVDWPGIQQRESGDYYIVTDSSSRTKKLILEKIARELNVDLIVDWME